MTLRSKVVRVAGVIAALAMALLLTNTLNATEEIPAEHRILQPGDNLIGWVYFSTDVQELFSQIPEAELIYTWDAKLSSYRFAARALAGNLTSVEAGMGLLVRIAGDAPVEWRQPIVANGERVSLESGPNLVAWTGPSGTPLDLAVRSIGDPFVEARYWNRESGELIAFRPGDKTGESAMPKLQRGDALWVFNSSASSWLQPSGDRPLYRLGPPPDHVRWYASFDKYLDADGLAVIATEHVADEALFRAAAILDEMLVNRPDIRETLIRQRVHTVVIGQSEATFDLTPYRQYRDRIELEPHGEDGPRGLGPNQYTPTLVPEENLLCYADDPYAGFDVAVHEFTHAIDYALSRSPSQGNFRGSLLQAYRSGIDSGFWDGTYAATNIAEYWAEAVGVWIGTSYSLDMAFKHRLHLMDYSPLIAQLIQDTLGDFQVDSSCHSARAPARGATRMSIIRGQVTDHLGEPLEGAGVLLRGASRPASPTLSIAWPDGRYGVFAQPRDYTMQLIVDGCSVFHTGSGPTGFAALAEAFSLGDANLTMDLQLEEPICTIVASGALLDADGNGVSDAYLTVQGNAGKSQTYSGEAGRFSVRFPDEGEYSLRFSYQGCDYFYDGVGLVRGPRYDLRFNARLLADAGLALRLPQGACAGTISGTLLDEKGNPAQFTIIGLHLPEGQSYLSLRRPGSFRIRVDLPSNPILEILSNGCRLYFGANGLKLDLDDVEPLNLMNEGIEGLKITIPESPCDQDSMEEA